MNRLTALTLALCLLGPTLALAVPAVAAPPDDAGPPDDRGRGGPPDHAGGDRGANASHGRGGGTDRGDGRGPPQWAREDRDVAFAANDTHFTFVSERASPQAQDAIHAAFDVENASLDVQYDDEAADTPRRLGLNVGFQSILEYRDVDGDGRYSLGDDVVQRVGLEGLAGAHVNSTAGANGSRLIHAVYPFDNGGNLTLAFIVTPVVADLPNTTVAPTETKFDVLIQDFPFTENDTAVALVTRANAGRDLHADDNAAAQPGLVLRDEGVEAFYRWVPESVVDGVNASVNVTVLAERLDGVDGNATLVVFSYARGAYILHDPTVGFTEAAAEAVDDLVDAFRGDWRLFGVGLVAAAALVVVTAGPRLRRRG